MTSLMIRDRSLDAGTAERMLRGAVAVEDVPNALVGTAALLRAARRPLSATDPAAQVRTLAAMVAVAGSPAPARPTVRRSTTHVTTKLAVGAAAGVISLFGGLTAASALSSSVSNGVTSVTGLSLPFAASTDRNSRPAHSTTAGKDTTADTDHARSTTARDTGTSGTESPNGTSADNHGACVSKVAQDKSTTGEAHGDAVSTAAKSDCGKPSLASKANGLDTRGANTQGPTSNANSNANHAATGHAKSANSPARPHV